MHADVLVLRYSLDGHYKEFSEGSVLDICFIISFK